MKQILIDKPAGAGFYPCISQKSGGGVIDCLTEAPPFYIENLSSEECLVTLTKTGSPNPITLNYSSDNQKTWTTFTTNGEGTFTIPANSKAYLKGNNSTFSTTDEDYYVINFNKSCNICGNMNSLIGDTDENIKDYTYFRLFCGNSNIVDASNLIISGKTAICSHCAMFKECTNLIAAPLLLATNIAYGCYYCMFKGCTSLETAPELPNTELSNMCYSAMFNGCTRLINAPKLPALTLGDHAYSFMFEGCTSLETAPDLPATTLSVSSYMGMFKGCTSLINVPKVLPALEVHTNTYHTMFNGCTALVNAPDMLFTSADGEATCAETFGGCSSLVNGPSDLFVENLPYGIYYTMFKDCTALIKAPKIHALTLANISIAEMFKNCTSLNYIEAMFTDEPTSSNASNWVQNVASSGTFVKNASANWDVTGANGIPEGWTVETSAA